MTDNCQLCRGTRGGVLGNENVVSVTVCDYCHIDLMQGKPLTTGAARLFPIMRGPAVPWHLIAPWESTAMRNHDQSLDTLAKRGGLDLVEVLPIMHGVGYTEFWTKRLNGGIPNRDVPPQAELVAELQALIASRQETFRQVSQFRQLHNWALDQRDAASGDPTLFAAWDAVHQKLDAFLIGV